MKIVDANILSGINHLQEVKDAATKGLIAPGFPFQVIYHLAEQITGLFLIYVKITFLADDEEYTIGDHIRYVGKNYLPSQDEKDPLVFIHEPSMDVERAAAVLVFSDVEQAKDLDGIHLVLKGITRKEFENKYGYLTDHPELDKLLESAFNSLRRRGIPADQLDNFTRAYLISKGYSVEFD